MDTLTKKEHRPSNDCPSIEIAAYIDRELTPDAEVSFESHLADCRICSEELNIQKQFVNALNSSLSDVHEVPTDFTKRIVTHAESGVSGLRKPKERYNALFVCLGLFFFVLFTLGASAPGAFAASFDVFMRVVAVVSFAGHLFYDIALGAIVIMRSISGQPEFFSVAAIVVVPLAIVLAFRISHTRASREQGEYSESGSSF